MGVTGLLPALKSIQEPCTLERYRGKTLAVDTYAWLHKAAFSCSMDIVMEKPTKAYVNYVLKRLDAFKHYQITPYMVFDGDYLPTKANTELERATKRTEYKRLAIEAINCNDKKAAFGYFQKACDISPNMAKTLIDEFKVRGIKYLVAPYEADSQMVYLEKIGLVDGIISEDSDLLVFGCKTLITKLNDKGECIEVKRENFKNVKSNAIGAFNDEQMRLMAAISGCDYTKGINGVGVLKAIQFIKRFMTYQRVMMGIKFEGKLSIPTTFDEEFKKATIAFKHQIVFNPLTKTPEYLTPLPEDFQESEEYLLSCTGKFLEVETHQGIANGDLDPFTKLPLISRELSVMENGANGAKRSMSSPVMQQRAPSQKNTLEIFTKQRAAMRSKSEPSPTPVITSTPAITNKKRKALFTIDEFMKRNTSTNTSKSTIRKLSPQKCNDQKVSPISKRTKLLFGSSQEKVSMNSRSKFFGKASHNHEPILINQEDRNISSADSDLVEGLNSSDFVLTDPDEDEGDADLEDLETKKPDEINDSFLETTEITGDVNNSAYIDSQDIDSNPIAFANILDDDDDDGDYNVDQNPKLQESINAKQLVDAWRTKFELKPGSVDSDSKVRPATRKPLKSLDVNQCAKTETGLKINTKSVKSKPSSSFTPDLKTDDLPPITGHLRLNSFRFIG
ncbi:hypothetical protein CANARDRAFT_28166 [[Candida] arabinofermentans NRRL YB-2248]|uniref:Uncharacterized protein n=1 Tax=[Candida] arabinofermentans NRRL YB-2248 TaxID=983967 RepID=A0A1E4T0U0_9ASCO|nr:hypothetical protein CANARDRAFT_28166 [[Candida] arabinofermentans NRRL YB-2248]